MKRLLLTASAVALGLPAAAQAEGVYIGAKGGYTIPSDSENIGEITADIPATADFDAIASGTSLGWTTEFDNGWGAGAFIGYEFENGFRIELNGDYTTYDVDTHSGLAVGGTLIDGVDSAVLTRGAASTTNPTVGAVLADGRGDVENYAGFINLLYGFDLGAVEPYFGGGLGLERTEVNFIPSGVGVVDDSDWGAAYQGIAGLGFNVSDKVQLFLEYNYRNRFEETGTVSNLLPATLGIETERHIGWAGLKVSFGGATPPPPPPPPAPPPTPIPVPPPPPPAPAPAPAPVAQCEAGPYIVFFDFDSSDITPEAASVLNSAVTAYGNCGSARVMLAGHTDRSGSVSYNMALAERRNMSVRDYLTGRGINGMRISTEAFGESQPRVATADGVRELQNRRVEITYGPGSGM